MSEILNKQITLALNRNWMPMDFRTVRKAIEDITSESPRTGMAPFMFLDLSYALNPDGTYDTSVLLNARPVSVEEWMQLEVRSCDLAINCARRQLRVPTIIVASSYADIRMKTPKFSPEAVRVRDNYTCQVTKQKLEPGEGDLAHNIARANGGQRTWENIAFVRKDLNRLQGTKTFAEMGWTHIKPKAPRAKPVFLTVEDLRHESQAHFLQRN